MRRIVAPLLLLFVSLQLRAAQKPIDAAELQLALKKLTVVGSVLYVGAHPDDENTSMLAYLASGRLVRTGYLSMTRGDGGQNLIGDEKGELLGLIRTQELLAARRIDGGEQFFTRALDFGFSKGPQETLAIWGHDTILADVVWNIRRFQPDVIIARFPTTGEGGHGHHTASAILAGEAFKAAADVTKFPEQLKYVAPWQPRRLFWNHFSWQQVKPDDPSLAKSLRADVGGFNALLGRSYTEIAGRSRSQHQSQGQGTPERRGTNLNYLDLLQGEPADHDILEGIDMSWSRYPGGENIGKLLQQASDTFDFRDPQKTIPLLLQAWDAMDRLGATPAWSPQVNPWIEVKRVELLNLIRGCAGISIDVSAADSSVVAGGELPVTVTVVNPSDFPFTLQTVGSLYANPSKGVGSVLKKNEPVRTEISIKLPADYPISQPYWLRTAPLKGSYVVDDQKMIGLPENPASIPLVVTLDDNQGHPLVFTVPATYRWIDPVRGEQSRNVEVVPDVTVNFEATSFVFPDAKPKSVRLHLQNFGGATRCTVRLRMPEGWSSEPKTNDVTFSAKGEEATATFVVTPPEGKTTGYVTAEVELPGGRKLTRGLRALDYPHIPAQRVFPEASVKLVRVNVEKRGSHVGYISGSGDEVPEALRQIGYDVKLLNDQELATLDFSQFDAIVAGVRAYNTRKILKSVQPRLMDYVTRGGTLVVQYNTDELVVDPPGPYPFKISRDRVTVEEAPIHILNPAHPVMNTPNKITQADFEGWVQERGLQFTTNWDPRYETILASNDPGDTEKAGGELFTRLGKGVFIYTTYDWFRELPAGVPGAYRLFANLVSAK